MTEDELIATAEEPVPEQGPGIGDRIAKVLITPLVLAFLIAFVLFNIAYTPIHVDGNSMDPTLTDGDRALATKAYRTALRGDIVIADIGDNGADDGIIKRVVGVAGDTVEIEDDRAIINGVPETRTALIIEPNAGEDREPLVVPEGHVYLMGDNRVISLDSRFIGTVPMERVYGKVIYVFWPSDSIGGVN